MNRASLSTAFRARLDRLRRIDPATVVPEPDRHRHTIKSVGVNGVVALNGRTFLAVGLAAYVETNEKFSKVLSSSWTELRLVDLSSGETVWLEWEEDDDLVVFQTLAPLSFANLADERGELIDEDDLDQISGDGDSIFYRGREFVYDDDYPARYERIGGQGKNTGSSAAFFYDFTCGDECVTVEEWCEGGNRYHYEIFLSRRIDPASIVIISPGSGGT